MSEVKYYRVNLAFKVFTLTALLVCSSFAVARTHGTDSQRAVLTQHNDNARTGAYLAEEILNTSNVNVNSFGKLFTRDVSGQIYAQPLYFPDLYMPGKGKRNVIFVATQTNDVYAFDADDPAQGAPLWHRQLGPSLRLPVIPCEEPGAEPLECDFGNRYGPFRNIFPNIGIISTPVIDPKTNTIYVVTFTHPDRKTFQHHIHALDIFTGKEKFGGPKLIEASVPGQGDGAVDGVVPFQSGRQLQRPALLLHKETVYVAFAGYADTDPYHGWVLGYDDVTLKLKSVLNTSPDGEEGGIWQSGNGLAVDKAGNMYAVNGNGNYNASWGGKSFGDAAIKISVSPTGALDIVDWFVPYNYERLQARDQDLGSSGIVLIPGTNLGVFGSKEGKIFVAKLDNMGKLGLNEKGHIIENNDHIFQVFQVTNPENTAHNIHGTPVTWENEKGKYIYVFGEEDRLKSFKFIDEVKGFDPVPTSTGLSPAPGGMPGGLLSLSADGNLPGTGIVWAIHPFSQNATEQTVEGIVEAYDASDVSRLLWSSKMNPARDNIGTFAKFSSVTIANSKVYVPTHDGKLVVYGLLPEKKDLPDLVVTEIRLSPADPTHGQAVRFAAVVKNQGTVATPENISTGVSFSVGGQQVSWAAKFERAIAPGESVTLTADGGPDHGSADWTARAGTHVVEAWVNDAARFQELKSDNNKLSKNVEVRN